MEYNQEVINLSNQLAKAVGIALNPSASQNERHEAYSACEEFKEKSPLCIQCSMYLSLNGPDLVRHYGLQLLEYCVKYKWYEIDQPQKVHVKDVTMSLLQTSDGDFVQHVHLRDALSRVVVEMMKREWPQHWPSLFPELFEIALKGHIQAEIVLLIFLRFIEDTIVLQTLEYAQRRKDLYQHLILQLEDMFTFLTNLMGRHYELNVPQSIRVINLCVKLLSEIVEFAFINRLVAEETRLLPVLCNFLSNENFQLEAVECLNRITTKKGKQEDKRIICRLLLNSTLIHDISRINLILQNGTLNERNYLFIKKVSELLASVCSLLCTVIRNENDNVYEFIKVENFIILLEMLIASCNHPSFVVAYHISTGWTSFFKHAIFSKDSNVLNYTTKWVNIVTPKLIRIPYNQENAVLIFQECYKYMIYDFDSEESFSTFFYRFRVELSDAFRHLTVITPLVTFTCVEQWLITRIHKTSLNLSATCSLFSEEFIEWEAVSTLFETIVSNLPKIFNVSLERSIQLLDLCLNLKPADPNIISLLLSCISPLLFFINNAPREVSSVYVPRVLDKIFTCLVFEIPGETKTTRSKNVRELRRHAACLLVKLSQKYPLLFLPLFDYIKSVFSDLKRDINQLCKIEIVTFLEAMLLVNNAFCQYERQSAFIKDVFDEVKDYWTKMSTYMFCDSSKFSIFIGLESKPSNENDIFCKNRGELMYCVDIIAAIVKRSSWPETKEAANNGGFIIGYEADQPIFRNPAAPHIIPALPGIFSLIKIMHCSWTREAKHKLPICYKKVHDLSELELKILYGAHINKKQQDAAIYEPSRTNSFTKIQNFLISLYESCFLILTKSCQSLGYNFYELPNFAPSFIASVFHNLDSVPDYRLRVMIKQFLKPFIYCCSPTKYDSILIPIFGYFSTYMFERLSKKWKYLKECRENGILNEDDDEDSKELIEDFLNIHLSREYMDIIKSMLLRMNISDIKQVNGDGVNSSEEIPSPMGSQNNLHYASNAYENLSELGVKFLRNETTRYGIINFLFNSIAWSDSTNSLKATFKIGTVIRQLILDGNMTEELAVQTIISLLQGLQLHGQHDVNRGLLLNCTVQIYHLLRGQYAKILEVMAMVPGINLDDLQKFDQKVLKIGSQNKADKGMKEMFRKLVNNLIGKDLGQLFKKKEAIRDLPRIEIARPKGENVINTSANENDIGLTNFFK